MRNYRTLDDVTEEYLRNHPEEIGEFVAEAGKEYSSDQDARALLNILEIVQRVVLSATMAEEQEK